jgi:hypothetical protein
MPGLTFERASKLHRDFFFDGRIAGSVYAQPLFWRSKRTGRPLVIVATESNNVYALDASTGKPLWKRHLGQPVGLSKLPCGNIDPIGITGTPVIDESRAALYLDAMIDTGSGLHAQHMLFGLSLEDGSTLPGFPIDVAQVLGAQGMSFAPRVQNQRGALVTAEGTLFVPYGGHFGDCGAYHGWVVGVQLDPPHSVKAWSTRGIGGGIWAPGGIAYDGRALIVATGNTEDVRDFADGEAVILLNPDLKTSDDPRTFFAPADWQGLDSADADLGGANPLTFNIRDAAGEARFVLALGKDGKAYLLNRDNLGGVGGALKVVPVSRSAIRTSPSVYPAYSGVFVAFRGAGIACPVSNQRPNLTVLRIQAHPSPTLSTAWCGAFDGRGSPAVTTTDGRSNPVVWIVGAEGDNRLHGFRGDTGEPLFTGGGADEAMGNVRRFSTILAAFGKLFVAADDRVYAFKL